MEIQDFLNAIVDGKHGFELGEPWKYSEDALAVVVPITRKNAPDRKYITMYEVLKNMKIEDTGSVSRVELQNKAGKAVFIRAGTIFEGKTQNRAAENSGVYPEGKNDLKVRCVHQVHGVNQGSEMKYGDIAPMSVTINLFTQRGQSAVWDSVRRYSTGDPQSDPDDGIFCGFTSLRDGPYYGSTRSATRSADNIITKSTGKKKRNKFGCVGETDFSRNQIDASHQWNSNEGTASLYNAPQYTIPKTKSDDPTDLLEHMKAKQEGMKMLDEMMQKVPLFDFQAGAIIFNPVGIVAIETFDHPKSWEAIKKEVIEKHGDKIMEEQANHLFELRPERVKPILKEFIKKMDKSKEETVRLDNFSETRLIVGDKVVGEYTLVDGKVIHAIVARNT